MSAERESDRWPELGGERWLEAMPLLHALTQLMGKVSLALSPPVNHWWHSALVVTPRGLATPTLHDAAGGRAWALELDLHAHRLELVDSRGERAHFELGDGSVSGWYGAFLSLLGSLEVPARIWPVPVEVEVATPFADDLQRRAYDREAVSRFHRALLQVDRLLRVHRNGFLGKSSPVHFFWGSFDMASARYSGRRAPPHPGGAPNVGAQVMREGYSHEVFSAGFWPGGGFFPDPAFYAYAYPSPEGFSQSPIRPSYARWIPELGEFVLPYASARSAADPDRDVLDFLESAYVAAAVLGNWDRASLERARSAPTADAAPAST